MTNFLPLFKEDQTIIFDLNNIVNEIYTAPFNVTLSAAFFTADDSIEPADVILPVSKKRGAAGQPSYFTVPQETASNELTIPRNVKKAIFTVSATGQAQEEVRLGKKCVLQPSLTALSSGGAMSYSPKSILSRHTARCMAIRHSVKSKSTLTGC